VVDGEALTGAGVLRSGVVAPVGRTRGVHRAPAPRAGLVDRDSCGVSGRGGWVSASVCRGNWVAHLGAGLIWGGLCDRLLRGADEEGDIAGWEAIAGLGGLDEGVVGDLGIEGGRLA